MSKFLKLEPKRFAELANIRFAVLESSGNINFIPCDPRLARPAAETGANAAAL